ncbi:MAG: class I SAM-dependent methyltransferase [Opitutaceae bacterium]
MNAAEYDNLALTEQRHWYYAGKRDVVHYWHERAGGLRKEHTLLDCGAGTGLFAGEMAARCRVLVLDDHEESLSRLRERFSPEQVLRVSAEGIPLADASVDAITALDVLEHIENDQAAVRQMARVLRPGGVAVITVPAGMALWSDWDQSLHHYRRYHRKQLRALFGNDDWEILHVNYTNVLIYPAVWVIRKWRAWSKSAGRNRTEDKIPPRWLNGLLRAIFVNMGRWRTPLPFGVSLLLVARRRG